MGYRKVYLFLLEDSTTAISSTSGNIGRAGVSASLLEQPGTQQSIRSIMEHLVVKLKTPDLAPERKQEVLEPMQVLLDQTL